MYIIFHGKSIFHSPDLWNFISSFRVSPQRGMWSRLGRSQRSTALIQKHPWSSAAGGNGIRNDLMFIPSLFVEKHILVCELLQLLYGWKWRVENAALLGKEFSRTLLCQTEWCRPKAAGCSATRAGWTWTAAEICKDHGEDLGEGCWISTRGGRPGHEDPAGQGLKTAVSSRLIGGNSQIYPRLGLLAENQELEPVFLARFQPNLASAF